MRVWLDDEREMPVGEYDVHVKTAHEAIQLLMTGKVTLISLDHDLGTGYETGQTVADYIERAVYEGQIPLPKCRIHSQNPVGRDNMKRALAKAYEFTFKNKTLTKES